MRHWAVSAVLIATAKRCADDDGRAGRHPDGKVILRPHLHMFREDFDDKWRLPIASGQVPSHGELYQSLRRLHDRVQLTHC
jgi:hypothetical protein